MAVTINPGDACPALTLPATEPDTISLPPSSGRGLVLFFYPRDNTSGCTTEAKDFTGLREEFAKKGYDILGISRDSLKSHQKFIEKQDLGIALASDEDGQACEAFGVWVEKKMYGKTFMGIERSTFLISKDGKIENVWRKVRVKEHAESVLHSI